MALELVLGPANSAKAGEVLGSYAAVAPRGAVLVVPTTTDAHHYRRELAAAGVVFGSVLTFSGLAREVARRAGYSSARLSELQRDRVLRGVLESIEFGALAASSRAPGFRRAAGELISELERALVTPQRFIAALNSWVAEDARRRAFAADLGRIYADYMRRLDRIGRVDRDLYAWRALDALRAAPAGWGRDEVFFYGFDELTPLQRDAVETLSRIVGVAVTVSLTYEAGRTAMAARAGAVQELLPLADRVLELPALDEHYMPGSRAALHHLERRLFEPAGERIDPGPAVRLLEAGGERAEAELVAHEILALRRAGIPAVEIAVVARSLRRAAPLLESVLHQYGIPVQGGRELPFTHTPLGRSLRAAARCALLEAHETRAEDLLDFLRTPGLLERPELADGLEAAVRRDGLRTAASARRRLDRRLPELDVLAGADDPGQGLCELGRQLLSRPHGAHAPVLSDAEELDARALATLARAVDEVSELGGRLGGREPGGRLGGRDLGGRLNGRELVELLDELMVPAGPPGPADGVLLAEPLEIRARRFRAVFVCGLQEGETASFPAPARPEPFLSDERRRELAACSGLRLALSEPNLERERYLFYSTVSRATEHVVLSYRSSDEEGNLALASPFVADVAELFCADWRQQRARRLLADVVWRADQAPTVRELARARAAEAAPALAGGATGPEPERRLGPLALSRLRHTEIVSAGALEAYAECPVRWLIDRELRPAVLEPESEAIVRGNLMHEALERVLAELGGPLTPATLDEARAILDRILAELGGDAARARLGLGRPEVVRTGALRAIEADLRRYLAHEALNSGRWRPLRLELRFGFAEREDSLPALELGEGDRRVRIRGAIDRVDVDGSGAAVIRDYKSGGTRPAYPAARWVVDRQLQVALYLLVVRELTDLAPAAGFYQPLRGDDLRPRGMYVNGTAVGPAAVNRDGRDAEEFDAQLQASAEQAVELAAALRSGALTPCPRTCSRDGCAFPAICRSQ